MSWRVVALVLVLVSAPLSVHADENAIEVAFLARGDHDLEWEIHALNGHGTIREVASKGSISRPAVSPNGKKIAFSGLRGDGDEGRYPLYVINHDGTGLDRITDVIGADTDPDWSPDGTRIAFSRDAVGNLDPDTCCDVWVVDADGDNPFEVPNTQGGINPSWSPAGDRLAFETPDGIYTITLQGGAKTQIAASGSRQPSWSPSGEQIAFVRFADGAQTEDEVAVYNVAGGTTSVVYSPGVRAESPTWVDEDLYIVTFDGLGFDDRKASRIRVLRASGAVSTLFNPSEEIVFASQAIQRCFGVTALGVGVGDVEGIASTGDCFGGAVVAGDFNNDGADDLAIGVRGDNGAGAVNVLYGGNDGLSTTNDQLITQDDTAALGSSEPGDGFGHSLAVGDFDNDGRDDLAIGVPEENDGSIVDSGGVEVIYGSNNGLDLSNSVWWSQDSSGIKGVSEAGDLFGWSLIAGDFNDDGSDDLAIGAPGESISGNVGTGAVSVLYGARRLGLTSTDDRFDQDSPGIKGVAESDDRFGWSVSAGDFDGDGADDLAIGVPGEDIGSDVDTGAVGILYGERGNRLTTRDHRYDQDSPGIKGVGEVDDLFGWSLAAGDFNSDGTDDLAVGSPGEDIGGEVDVGAVAVLYGSLGVGVSTTDQRFDQANAAIPGLAEEDDLMGHSLAIGDFDGDGYADLGVGLPGEDRNGLVDVGGFLGIYGSASGLGNGRGEVWIDQGTSGVPGANEADDRFAWSLASGDYDGDGFGDVALGVQGEDIGVKVDAGGINIIYGASSGLILGGSRFDQGA